MGTKIATGYVHSWSWREDPTMCDYRLEVSFGGRGTAEVRVGAGVLGEVANRIRDGHAHVSLVLEDPRIQEGGPGGSGDARRGPGGLGHGELPPRSSGPSDALRELRSSVPSERPQPRPPPTGYLCQEHRAYHAPCQKEDGARAYRPCGYCRVDQARLNRRILVLRARKHTDREDRNADEQARLEDDREKND